jgi:hypothetical protein
VKQFKVEMGLITPQASTQGGQKTIGTREAQKSV